ncbi:nitroreductase [Plantactinospora sp. B6F1]|uniref:nitroreductase n=1 Tax=Plantactinospora sp. B6F1 TaxID=3158971 RepID=UPI00102AB69D
MSPTGYSRTDLGRAVAAAAQAPAAERSRPWLRLRDGAIDVLVTPDGDPAGEHAGWAARIGGGAGLFNVRLALAVSGRPALVRLRPYRDEPELLARLHPGPAQAPGPAERELFAALSHGYHDAGPVVPAPVPSEVRRRLIDAAQLEHGWLELIVGYPAVAAFTEIEAGARRVLERGRADAADAADAVRWRAGAPPSGEPGNRAGPGADRGSPATGRPVPSAPAHASGAEPGEPMVAVLGSPLDTPGDQLRAGQALQRVLVTAASAGLTTRLQAQAIVVPAAREQLRLALGRYGRPQMVLWIGRRAAHRVEPATAPARKDRPGREDQPGPQDGNRTAPGNGYKVPGTTGPAALSGRVAAAVE